MNQLNSDKQALVLAHLVEANSIRSTERLTGINRDTIMRLGLKVGQACHRLHDQTMRNLHVPLLQIDEQWSFVNKKQKHLAEDDPPEFGDQWTYVAESITHRAIIAYRVG